MVIATAAAAIRTGIDDVVRRASAEAAKGHAFSAAGLQSISRGVDDLADLVRSEGGSSAIEALAHLDRAGARLRHATGVATLLPEQAQHGLTSGVELLQRAQRALHAA